MTKNQSITFRVAPELKEALEALAKADRRSLSTYVEIVLEGHVKAKKKP